MTTDAIVLLKDDHKEILRAFRDFEQAGDDALKTKGGSSTGSSSCSPCTPTSRTR